MKMVLVKTKRKKKEGRKKEERKTNSGEWIKKMWYIYAVEYHSAIKGTKLLPFAEMRMDLETQTEWSKSEREKHISYHIAYMWNLEKWHRWTYLQSRSRDRDIENKHMNMKDGRGVGWTGRLGLTYTNYYA